MNRWLRRFTRALLHIGMMAVVLPCSAQTAALKTVSATAMEPIAKPAELMVAVHINGQVASDFAVLLEYAGHYCATSHEFVQWRLTRASSPDVSRNGEHYYCLDTLPGAKAKLDSSLQILYMQIPAEDFVDSTMQATNAKLYQITPPEPGLFFNQDVQFLGATGTATAANGLVEGGVFNKWGVLTTRYVASDLMQSQHWYRLDTQFLHDFPKRMTTLVVGDTQSAVAPWSEQVYFCGVKYASKFSTQPSFIPVALPSMAGQVTVPSTIDIYMNNVKLSQQQVDPGPFSIQNIPVMTNQGDLRMVVTDVMGRQQVITQPFIKSQTVLRKGVNDFTYEAGTLRYGYGMAHTGYTSVFGAATQRYGLTNSLTLDGRLEILPNSQTVGVGADYSMMRIGVFSGAIALSHGEHGGGGLVYGLFQHQTRDFGFTASVLAASSEFRELGMLSNERAARVTAGATVSRTLGPRLSLAAGYFRREGRSRYEMLDDPNVINFSGVTGTANWRINHTMTLISSVAYSPGATKRTQASFTLVIPLGPRDLIVGSSQLDKETTTATIDYTHSAPVGPGIGYRVRGDLADNRGVDAGVYAQSTFGSYLLEVGQRGDTFGWRAGERSGLVYFHNKLIATPWLANAFGVVEVPQPGIRVLENNQYIGSTGKRGIVVLPSIIPYSSNAVRIDDQGVPIDLAINLEEKHVVPMPRTGVYVKFAAAKVQGALLELTLEDGKPVPLGAKVYANGSTESDMVAMRGEVFVPNIELPGKIHVTWYQHQCDAEVPAPTTNEPLPKIGPLVCRGAQ